MNHRDLADFCFLGLKTGMLSLEEVRAWADLVIAERDEPPRWALDLCTADVEEAITALNSVPEVPTPGVSIQLLGALMRRQWKQGSVSLREIVEIGWQLHLENLLPQPSIGGDWGVILYCENEEFVDGYRTLAAMRDSVESKLTTYAAHESDLPGWIALHRPT